MQTLLLRYFTFRVSACQQDTQRWGHFEVHFTDRQWPLYCWLSKIEGRWNVW